MSKKILIIDDSDDILYTLGEICDFAGFSSVKALNGKEGLQLFLQEEPDLILIDYHMPVMDGLVLLKTIRQMDEHTPIIILTVDENQEVANRFLDEGASDFALKPIKAPDIIARIQVHLKMAALIAKQQNSQPKVELSTNVQLPFVTKGIASGTLQIIVNYLKMKKESVTLEKISEETGISYPTVHRYINHLVNENSVTFEAIYGNVGRPKNYYRWLKQNKVSNMQ